MTEDGDPASNVFVLAKIRKTWTKLSNDDLANYQVARSRLVSILMNKYRFTRQQAEDALSNVERIATYNAA